jgi:hypothetical protein
MLSQDPRPRIRADADATRTRLERRLRRYAPAVQAAVQKTARGHPRVADLALSFPTLLFALAVPRRGDDAARALAAAIDGRPLADVAQAARVPVWLRRLPVDALTKPLPHLPDGDLFRRRIVNHLPCSPKRAPAWLAAVSFAAQWAHEPFAIWIARELARSTKEVKLDRLKLLSLWAWFSMHPGAAGHRIIDKPWHPAMRFKTALAAAEDWRERAALHVYLGGATIADPWLTPGCVYGYEFVPLRCADDIVAEAAAMKNCLNTYGYNLAHNRSRLWSVRMNGRRVATLRLTSQASEPLITIRELRGERNRDVSVEVWWAARRWLHQHDLPAIDTKWHRWGKAPLDAAAWRSLWRPYWLDKQGIPQWLAMMPSRGALAAL